MKQSHLHRIRNFCKYDFDLCCVIISFNIENIAKYLTAKEIPMNCTIKASNKFLPTSFLPCNKHTMIRLWILFPWWWKVQSFASILTSGFVGQKNKACTCPPNWLPHFNKLTQSRKLQWCQELSSCPSKSMHTRTTITTVTVKIASYIILVILLLEDFIRQAKLNLEKFKLDSLYHCRITKHNRNKPKYTSYHQKLLRTDAPHKENQKLKQKGKRKRFLNTL